MGREANCKCQWSGTTANVKALLETNELLLRGEMRKRVPFREMSMIEARADALEFKVGGEKVSLFLGPEAAAKWAEAIRNPPSLARKLGITDKTRLHTIGAIEDAALSAAIAEAGEISPRQSTLALACVDTPESLRKALKETKQELLQGVPIWLVYRKGPGHPLNESQIRAALIAAGMVDTKTAAVSATLTALRFNRRKG